MRRTGLLPRVAGRQCGDSLLVRPVLDRTMDALQPRIAEVAKRRGLDWAKLSDEERERLVDDVFHE